MKPHPAPNKEARRRKRPPASHAAAIIMTFTLLAASIFGSMSPVFHQVLGAPEPIEIREVDEDEFEEPGYSSSINFTDIEVINGWTYQEEISQYYSTAGTPPLENGDRNTVAPKGPGYAFFIDSSTKPDPVANMDEMMSTHWLALSTGTTWSQAMAGATSGMSLKVGLKPLNRACSSAIYGNPASMTAKAIRTSTSIPLALRTFRSTLHGYTQALTHPSILKDI